MLMRYLEALQKEQQIWGIYSVVFYCAKENSEKREILILIIKCASK